MKPIIRQMYYWCARLFAFLVQCLPYRGAVVLGGMLGSAGFSLIRKSRRIVLDQLRRSFPERSEGDIIRIGHEVFVNQGKNAFELFSFPRLGKDDIDRIAAIENRAAIEEGLRRGKGVLLASAHCGNWEFMGASLSLGGFPVNVIARRIYIEGLNRMLVGYRTSKGMKVILRSGQESARQILRSLRHNETIGMLIDQDTAVPGVFVDFFGRKAWTPSGLATLALRTGASVVLALDVRMPGDVHRVVLKGPLTLTNTGNIEADVHANTAMITALIEEHIRKYPSQWVWMHERWKTQQPAAQNH
jgi:Kdo2-lipid IVA lauroyltransferase/acyltransferase